MVKIYLLLLLTAHLLGGVYLQREDSEAHYPLLRYLLPFVGLGCLIPVSLWVKVSLLVALLVVTLLFCLLEIENKLVKPTVLVSTFVMFSYWFSSQTLSVDLLLWQDFFSSQNGQLVKFLCLAVWLFKPANTVFKVLFDKYQYSAQQGPAEWPLLKKVPSTVEGAGAVIGNLERLMMAIFLTLNQYAAIGLILTAKSITRYNKITHDPAFSEYYLIGTLYSLLATLIPYVLIFHFV